ncbi:MAG: efflux RND transporter periplasmic adaptor subunit [Lewinellaceae bacterium]|nr:efflux RND transporter periplasmic adaptor subunit [Lewinellaceae bacterium]
MNNWKIFLSIIITAVISLGAGYLLFGGKTAEPAGQEEGHQHPAAAEQEAEIWTCSMHPQIRQNEPGNCPICGMELIPLSEASSSNNPLVMEMTPEAVKLANVQTIAVGNANGANTKTISLTGKVKTDERLVSSQVAHVPGRIEQLFVTFTGEEVRKGQRLATIYSPELATTQRELIEALKWKDSQPQLLEAARNKLRNWKVPEATIEEIESSKEVKTNVTIYADQSGVVLKRRVSVGDYLKEGGVLFDIASLGRVWLLFDAYEEDLAEIRVGDVVSYTVPAIPGRTFSARISFIDPVIDPQARIAALRAEVSNPGGLLKPEMFLRGTITSKAGGEKGALSVPKTAVLWTGPRSVVYVEIPGATVPSYEFREVTLGDAAGGEYIVKEGLEAGERVVVNGAFVIDAAAQLNNMASMMNRNVRQTGMAETVPDYTAGTPEAFRKQLMSVIDNYLLLKNAFVDSDPGQAGQRAEQVLMAIDKVDMGLLKGNAHMFWMEKMGALQAHGNAIRKSEDIEEQRKQFSFFTNALVETITAFGTEGSTLYLQHCPMAFDNEGADWLSTEEAISNPYYGEKMLKCGSVKETFPLDRRPTAQANPSQLHKH